MEFIERVFAFFSGSYKLRSAAEEGHVPFRSIEKVFRASSDRQGEHIVALEYCSEITFKGKAGS